MTIKEGLLFGFYNITHDPHCLFSGLFRKFDFAISFKTHEIWAAGTRVVDENGTVYEVVYEPVAGLLREDNVLYKLDSRHWKFLAQGE